MAGAEPPVARRVLVLRPQPAAQATASLLADRGFRGVVLPLSETVPIVVETPAGVDQAAALAATSANAVRHAGAALIARLRSKPLFAVGTRTAAAAREAGFEMVHAGSADGLELARHLVGRLPTGIAICYLCGQIRRPEFEEELAARGLVVLPLPTYDTLPIRYSDQQIADRLGHEPFWAVMVHSPNAGAALAALSVRPPAAPLLDGARIAAISHRAATALGGSGCFQVEVAKTPTEGAMLDLLSSWS